MPDDTTRLAALGVVVTVLAGLLVPTTGAPGVGSASEPIVIAGVGVDAVLHVVGFAALTWSLCVLARARTTRRVLAATALALVLAVATEAAQLHVPGRQGDPWDVVADAGGTALATVGWWLRRRIQSPES